MNITNETHRLQAASPSSHGKPGLLKRLVRALWDSNQRIYVSAITDPTTGRVNPAVERQIVLMMLG